MPYRPNQPALQRLHETAHRQGGYVTAKQAAAAGFGYTHLEYHGRVGNLERVERGLYRVPTIPPSEHDDLVRLSLWSRDRTDRPQATVSHVTALVLHGLTDLLPSAVHLSVPKRFYRKPPRGCVLHRRTLEPSDMERHAGFSITKPLRTLTDAAAAPDVPQDELTRAVMQALERGLVGRGELMETAQRSEAGERMRRALGLERGRRRSK